MKKHFNLWMILSLPIFVLLFNQIHVALSLGVLGGAFVWLATEYDQISFDIREKDWRENHG